ncbi:E3 ubiquitin-protein ligase RNF13-like [Strigops habroptila]|uniref:E3 ubiquitin-protein ligase RNF13-like n=1 Tax=Strigops habroptila TaxID=2489341 RepID=UPI0011CF3BA0|nr:E3 ubiquitin-protein ligase RNF13-like [Strigops habroptila]
MNLWLQLLPFVVTTAFCKVTLAEIFAYVAYNDSSKCVAYKALPACFGPRLPAEGLTGYLVRVIPPNACHAIENPPAPRQASETYIALIQGYGCSFVKKVLHAQQAGYQTAVVYNVDSEELSTMMADDKEIQQLIEIPSLFTGQSVSLHLQRTLQCAKGVYVRLLPPKLYLSACQENTKMLEKTFTTKDCRDLFYITIANTLIIVGLIWYKRAHRTKLHTYKKGDKHETCVICMAGYKEGDHLKILSCSHAYHSVCIDTWFRTLPGKKTCPFCKQSVNTYGQGDLLPEQAGEDANEEEWDQEDDAFREGHEDEYAEEEKDDASSVEGERFDAPENNIT